MTEGHRDGGSNGGEDARAGFRLDPVSFDMADAEGAPSPAAYSNFSKEKALQHAQLIDLTDNEGEILFHPGNNSIDVGDVLFLRERLFEDSEVDSDANSNGEPDDEDSRPDGTQENGVIVQIISLGTASYHQASTKALFRLMVNVRASVLERSHNEPPEVIDEFMLAAFRVRASIVGGQWGPPEGRVVNRNVDIFTLDPTILSTHIFEKVDNLNVNLGQYKEEAVEFFGGGFEKINLITGMKGSGKSHIAKGIISESAAAGMSAVVFDINNEYQGIPSSSRFVPSRNLRFRLDRIQPATFIYMVDRIAPFAERTAQVARMELPRVIRERARQDGHVPDIPFLQSQAGNIITRRGEPGDNMRASFQSSLETLEGYDLIMTEAQAQEEMRYITAAEKGERHDPPAVVSLSSVLYNLEHGGEAGVIVFDIGGLLPFIQYVVVDLVIDTLKRISHLQTEAYRAGSISVPNYPTVFFEEAHMYMEIRVINDLLPLIRHYGMNVFFVTNTPGALPDSVFRLVDNLVMTRMLNRRDIDQVKNCGLTDAETITGFARNLREYHALLLSGINGATKNFPLVFKVRDFGLPASGESRSMWMAMKDSR